MLTLPQIDRIRYHLFPEIRIQRSLFENEETTETAPLQSAIPDLIQIMDLQQEQLARSLREGHRVIHGVAGSGKTLILAYRCLHLAEKLNKPILVLTFNVTLAARLRQMISDRGVSDRVSVYHFHRWCAEQLRLYHVPQPAQGEGYAERLVQTVIQAVDAGQIPAAQYGAVMIDEGHDFQAEWLKLVVQMIDPDTNSLLLLYDDAQSINEGQKKCKFSFKSVGIQAQGRTTILSVNYRNTAEVLTLAYEFAKEVMQPTDGTDEDVPVLVQPRSAGRHGPVPEIIKLPRFRDEVQYLAQRFQQLYERGTPWNEMAIVYRTRFMAEEVVQQFQNVGIPVTWLNQSSSSRYYDPSKQSIKLVTMHSSKGLEFPIVAIPGIGFLPHQNGTPEEEARLLYVAMTRAVNQLILTCDRDSEFVKQLEGARERVSAA